MRDTANYYCTQYGKGEMSLAKISDIFSGFIILQTAFVEKLVQNKKLKEAKAFSEHFRLQHKLSPQIKQTLNRIADGGHFIFEIQDVPAFGPASKDEPTAAEPLEYFKIPEHQVKFIGTEEEVHLLEALLNDGKWIGIDSEWRPNIIKFQYTPVAVLQLSGKEHSFVIDMIALSESKLLDETLKKIFNNENSTIVGFSYGSDNSQFQNSWPDLTFFHRIRNFIDAQTYYQEQKAENFVSGLAKIVSELFPGKVLCKKEQISNWTRRPLRKSQIHYGALDAYILVEMMEKLTESGNKLVRTL